MTDWGRWCWLDWLLIGVLVLSVGVLAAQFMRWL